MFILELEYVDDKECNEIIDSDLLSGFEQGKYQADDCLVAIYGSTSDQERIGAVLEQTIKKDRIWFGGKSSIAYENRLVRYILFAVSQNIKKFSVCNIAQESTKDIEPQHNSSLAELTWALLNDATCYAGENNSDKVQLTLQQIKLLSQDFDPVLKAALSKTISEFNNFLSVDRNYYTGNEVRSPVTIMASNYVNELSHAAICKLRKDFELVQSNITPHALSLNDSLKKRIDFLKVGKDLADRLNSATNIEPYSQLIFWYVGYICSLVVYHQNRKEYSPAISLAVRVLELACQSILLDANEASFNYRGKFIFNNTGQAPQGVMALWDASKNSLSTSIYGKYEKEIEELIKLRNSSIFGHGVTHANKTAIDNHYKSLLAFIESYYAAKKASVKLWRNLHNNACVNVISDVGMALSHGTLSKLALN